MLYDIGTNLIPKITSSCKGEVEVAKAMSSCKEAYGRLRLAVKGAFAEADGSAHKIRLLGLYPKGTELSRPQA